MERYAAVAVVDVDRFAIKKLSPNFMFPAVGAAEAQVSFFFRQHLSSGEQVP